MSIEIKLQSVVLQSEDIQEQFPELIPAIKAYLPKQKTHKRRRARKTQKLVCSLIDDIIQDINTK